MAPTALDLAAMNLALAPVRDGVLARAKRDAGAVVSRADARVGEELDKARAREAETLAEAREQGAADAAENLASERSRIRRAARGVVLRARRAAYEQLLMSSREAVSQLREDPDYPQLLARLAALAKSQLGEAATVREAESGGVTGVAGQRRLDLSLATLADRAVAALGAELEELWAP